MDTGTFGPVGLSWADVLIRMGASVLLALSIGVERFVHRKPVDFRPFVIIAAASCALTIGILELGDRSVGSGITIDPAKVISGVMTGIGFLGAGALFREKHYVQGAGSAASIWAAGGIGLICGMGSVWLGLAVAAVVVVTLLVGGQFASDYTVSAGNDDEDGS